MPELIDTFHAAMQANEAQDDDKFLSFLTDDIEYHYHVGTRPLIGKEWVRKFLKTYRQVTSNMSWRVDNFADKDDKLFIEGYEEYQDRRTNEWIAHPYMAILEFRDGKVAKWRDYYEMDNKKSE